MKILALLLGLMFWVSTAMANLGDGAEANVLRHNTQPVKFIMINDDPALKLHLVIYNENGAWTTELIGAETVIAESIYCNQNSVEPPESVFNRMKSLYGEGQKWEEVGTKVEGNGHQAVYQRTDHMFGIRKIWWDDKSGIVRYDAFVQIGKAQIIAGLMKIDELNSMFKLY